MHSVKDVPKLHISWGCNYLQINRLISEVIMFRTVHAIFMLSDFEYTA